MAKKMYVTYHWRKLGGNLSNIKAIECADEKELEDVYFDITSIHGIYNVRVNRSGRIPKSADIISHADYRNGKYYHL